MQAFGVERPLVASGKPRLPTFAWLLIIGVLVLFVAVIVFVVIRANSSAGTKGTGPIMTTETFTTETFTTVRSTTTIAPSANGAGVNEGDYHGYETMPFYLHSPLVSYVAPNCNSSNAITATSPPASGYAGPFSLGSSDEALTYRNFNVCSDNGTKLGTLNIHKDPCDPVGKPARIGIQNMGNSCFLNSAMQVLLGIPGICVAIFDERNLQEASRSPLPALRDFIDKYRASSSAVKRENARKFRQALLQLKVVSSITGQEDSGEALTRLFNLYNFPSDSMFISRMSTYVTFHRSALVEDTSGKDDFLDATCDEDDPNECRTDGDNRFAALVTLQLPLTPQDSIELKEIYDTNFGHERRIEHDEPLRVRIPPNPIQGATEFENVKNLTMAPQLLLNMQLESYDLVHDRVRKRNDKIQVPSTWQGMTLVGISQHLGSDNSGHYIAFKKRCTKMGISSKEWIKYDDDRVSLEETSAALDAAVEGKLLYYSSDPQLPSCESLESS